MDLQRWRLIRNNATGEPSMHPIRPHSTIEMDVELFIKESDVLAALQEKDSQILMIKLMLEEYQHDCAEYERQLEELKERINAAEGR